NVLAARFRYIAFGVEHDGFVIAGFFHLMLGQDGVDIVSCRLALGHHDVDMMAGKRRDLRPDAISQSFITEVCTPGKNCDAHTDRIFWRVKTQLAKPDEC